MKKVLITNKVTTHFFITPFKSIPSTLHALPTAFSRITVVNQITKERKVSHTQKWKITYTKLQRVQVVAQASKLAYA